MCHLLNSNINVVQTSLNSNHTERASDEFATGAGRHSYATVLH